MKTNDKLLREYIREMLSEEDGGGGGGGDSSSSSSSGGGFGGGGGSGGGVAASQLKGALDPILDIFKVAAGKSKEIKASIKNLLGVSLRGFASVLTLGAYDPDYDKLKQDYQKEINDINKEYGQTYAKSWAALDKSGVTLAAFLYNPAAYLTAKNPTLVLKTALNIYGVATVASWLGLMGTSAAVFGTVGTAILGGSTLKNVLDKLKEKGTPAAKKLAQKLKNIDVISGKLSGESLPGAGVSKDSIDNYFSEVKTKLQNLKSTKELDKLPLSLDTKNQLQASLKNLKEEEKKQFIEKFIEKSKLEIVTHQLKSLQNQRQQLLNSSIAAGVSKESITQQGTLYDRYSKEIVEIARMWGLSSSEIEK